ncbi:CHASE3 domain-containing protein [Rhizobium sp. HT1-10]|uniref:CHASE3 domain-containing protein n=1 Tax=Rhizobium sp. HT1-10 TaxID=3111638 RepID=UPI003C13BF8B
MDWSWRSMRRNYLTTPVLLRSIPVGVVIAAGVIATTWTHSLMGSHQQLVVRTFEIVDTTKDVLIGLDDAETGQRGYLLSGDRRYLDPYQKALSRLTQLRATLKASLSDDADQSARMTKLDMLVDEKLDELKQSIILRDSTGFEAARALEIARMEQATMDAIRKVIGDITEAEKALLATRQSKVEADETLIRVVAVLVGLASFLTRACIELYLARRDKHQRQRQE